MTQADTHRAHPQRGSPARLWPVALALAVGLVLTWLTVDVLQKAARKHDQERFEAMTKGVMEMIDTRFELFAQALTGLRDLFALRETVDDRLWFNYVEAMYPKVQFKGLHELGFAERVFAPDERVVNYLRTNAALTEPFLQPGLEEHLTRLRLVWGTNYSIRPLESDLAPHAFPVTRCWRVDGAQEVAKKTMGQNLSADAEAGEAIAWTVGTGLPAATAGVNLETARGPQRGVRLFLNVARPEMPTRLDPNPGMHIPNDPAFTNRHWRLGFRRQDRYTKGLVYFTIELDAFLRSTLGEHPAEIGFALYTDTNRTPAQWLHGPSLVDYTAQAGSPYLTRSDRLLFYGRKLHFDFYTRPTFETRSLRVWPRVAGGAGGLLTLLAAGVMWASTRARLRQEAIAADLRESRDRLQAALLERDRLHRDLHDTVIQSIYATGLGLQSARRILGQDAERAGGRITELMADLNGVIARLRGYIEGVPAPSGNSLAGQLEETLAPFRRETKAAVILRVETTAQGGLDAAAIIQVASIVREAVSNAVQHAEPTTINVRVSRSGDFLIVEIEDDGRGFNSAVELVQIPGRGLNNIRARVAEMNGTAVFDSLPGRGTVVRVVVPFLQGPLIPQPS